MAEQVYRCENPDCTLGALGEAGHFTVGASEQQLYILTKDEKHAEADPDLVYEAVCPNCGKPGVEAKEDGKLVKHESLVGEDPHQDLHDKIAAEYAAKYEAINAKQRAGELSVGEAAAQRKALGDSAQAALEAAVRKRDPDAAPKESKPRRVSASGSAKVTKLGEDS